MRITKKLEEINNKLNYIINKLKKNNIDIEYGIYLEDLQEEYNTIYQNNNVNLKKYFIFNNNKAIWYIATKNFENSIAERIDNILNLIFDYPDKVIIYERKGKNENNH